jgi:CRISPR-associated protein Cmr2
MSNYLFALTITPVQSFITQARKTKDLFAGSEILSKLIEKALEQVEKKDIIFPHDTKIVSNKFVISLHNKTEKEVEALGAKLKNCINKTCINLMFEHTKLYDNFYENFFQVFWVAVELANDYQQSYKRLEQSLGAIKNLRVFEQEKQEGARKCSLCGERNGAFYKYRVDEKGKQIVPKYISKKAIALRDNNIQDIDINQIKDNETLCSICFTKRFYQEDFPSLAKITLLDWLNNVDYEDLKENLKNFDEELFFEDNLNDKYLEKVEVDKKAIIKIKSFIKDKKLDTKEQKKYYALIQFDIDSLGKTLSDLDKERQKRLSQLLAEFAKESKKIVDKAGQTIYAGGDDFLGFVNLSYLFEVIIDVQKAFGKTVKKEFSNLTYSTSIVIAHYKAPLHKVLDYSRELLAQTKNYFDKKNGVGIIVLSDSAINAKTICKYNDLTLLKEMRDKKIGMNLHYKLNSVFNFLDRMSLDDYLTYKQMIKTEIKRLLKKEEKEFNQEIYDSLSSFFGNQNIKLSTNNYQIDFDNFIGYLKTLEQLKKVM